jgi:hypothetical protein
MQSNPCSKAVSLRRLHRKMGTTARREQRKRIDCSVVVLFVVASLDTSDSIFVQAERGITFGGVGGVGGLDLKTDCTTEWQGLGHCRSQRILTARAAPSREFMLSTSSRRWKSEMRPTQVRHATVTQCKAVAPRSILIREAAAPARTLHTSSQRVTSIQVRRAAENATCRKRLATRSATRQA